MEMNSYSKTSRTVVAVLSLTLLSVLFGAQSALGAGCSFVTWQSYTNCVEMFYNDEVLTAAEEDICAEMAAATRRVCENQQSSTPVLCRSTYDIFIDYDPDDPVCNDCSPGGWHEGLSAPQWLTVQDCNCVQLVSWNLTCY